MSLRSWLSVVTLVFIVILIYITRHEIVHAWELMGSVDIWILLLLIPGQAFVYYAAGEMIFSYLRAKGSIHHLNSATLGRMALEMNFVNHVLPSAGVSGLSYMNWRLHREGIPISRATMAQIVRFAMGFVAFILLLLVSVVIVTVDQGVNRWVLLLSALLVGAMVVAIALGIFLLSGESRVRIFSRWLTHNINRVVRFVTFGRHPRVLQLETVIHFFEDLHRDYLALRRDRRVLVRPFLWGIVFTIGEIGLFMLAFLALGEVVNPAVILIAYGLAALAGFFMVTPGGAGAYEAIMVSFLALAGVPGGVAIAGTLLTRVILLLGTIVFGYVFYQHALIKYGKRKK